ncbi:MAG TPA: hypothetical protein VHY09_09685 [Candidatus Methylacidiphilales bacterium]|nr:hypothetical protein [Candidatus Methylacidiphilales bacterium]
MRLAILISLAALALGGTPATDDDALVKCDVGPHGGYLVPVSYCEKHRADILATLPDEPEVDGFWKVTEQIAIVADRNLRETLEDAVKDPTLLFPDLTPGKDATLPDSLEYQRNELKAILDHYGTYHRQYVGLVVNGHEIVLLNYASGPQLDPAAGFLFIHRVFEAGKTRFLQARYYWDYDIKSIGNVSTYGSWQEGKD